MSIAYAGQDSGFARTEHVVEVEVESIDGGRGTILPRVIHWSHGESYKVEYVVHWMRVPTDGSDVKLFRYTLHVLKYPLFLYREEYPDGGMRWYVGLN